MSLGSASFKSGLCKKSIRRKSLLADSFPPTKNVSILCRDPMSDSKIPLRDERKVCYVARDAFFTCCDRNNIDNPLKDVDNVLRVCKREKTRFEKDCIASWVRVLPTLLKFCVTLLIMIKVEYFMRKRIVDKRKELMYADETKLATK